MSITVRLTRVLLLSFSPLDKTLLRGSYLESSSSGLWDGVTQVKMLIVFLCSILSF